MELDRFKRLDQHEQHCGTSRLQHSINVSYYSFLVARRLNMDYKSAARGGLLHDLFFYNWRDKDMTPTKHSIFHPQLALRNAKRLTIINSIEEDIIIKHMWPITIAFPRYKESYIVTLADKYCAIAEMVTQKISEYQVKLAFSMKY